MILVVFLTNNSFLRRENIAMKIIYLGILLLVTHVSFSQIKKCQEGWYQGETKDFVLYQHILAVNDKSDFIDVETVSLCLHLQKSAYLLKVGEHSINGALEVEVINKKELKVTLKSTDFGPFTMVLNKRKKYGVLIGKSQQPSILLHKLKKKAACN